MARYTIREFTDAIGLGKDRDSVTRSGIILKALCGLGIARESGRKHGTGGRAAVLYEVSDPIVIPLVGSLKPVGAKEALVEVKVPACLPGPCGEVQRPDVASATLVVPKTPQRGLTTPQFTWGSDEDDD